MYNNSIRKQHLKRGNMNKKTKLEWAVCANIYKNWQIK